MSVRCGTGYFSIKTTWFIICCHTTSKKQKIRKSTRRFRISLFEGTVASNRSDMSNAAGFASTLNPVYHLNRTTNKIVFCYPSNIKENKIILELSLSITLENFRFGSRECVFIKPLLNLISGERMNTGK